MPVRLTDEPTLSFEIGDAYMYSGGTTTRPSQNHYVSTD